MSWLDKIKKLIVPNQLVIASAGTKDLLIIFKPISGNQDYHFTQVMKQSGYVEFHLTKEKSNEHITLLKGLINIDKIKYEAEKLYKRSLKPVNKNDRRYKDFRVLVPKDLNILKNINPFRDVYGAIVEKNRLIFPSRSRIHDKFVRKFVEKYFDEASFGSLVDEDLKFAIAFSSRDRIYYLFIIQGSRYLFPVSEALKILPNATEWKEILCGNCGNMVNMDCLSCSFCGNRLDGEPIIKLYNLFNLFKVRF